MFRGDVFRRNCEGRFEPRELVFDPHLTLELVRDGSLDHDGAELWRWEANRSSHECR